MDVRDVSRRLRRAAVSAGRPRPTLAQFGQRRLADSRSEQVAPRDLSYAAVGVRLVLDVAEHGCEVAVVVVIERMTSVALARPRIWEVTQTTGPQQGATRVGPRAVELRLRNCSESLVHGFETRDCGARVHGIDLARAHG